MRARIAQLVKTLVAGSSLAAGEVFSWHGLLAGPLLQIGSMASDHHYKKI